MKKIAFIGSSIAVTTALAFGGAIAVFAEDGAVNATVNATSAVAPVSAKVDAKVEARVTNFKDKAGKEIDRRVEALNKLLSRVNDMKRVSDAGKASMSTTFSSQVTALNALKAKIDAEGDVTTLKTDVKSITDSYRIFALVIPQGEIVAAADRIISIGSTMNTLGVKLNAKITAAETAGKDVAALKVALNDIGAKIVDAQALAQAAVSAATTLNPDNCNQTIFDSNKKVLVDAHGKIKAAHADLVTARKDIDTIVKALKAFNIDTTSSAGTP